jgi:hypothetical protein
MDIAVASHKILQMLQNGSYSDFKEAASKQYFKLAFEVDTLDPSLKVFPIFQKFKAGDLPVANGNGTPQLGRAASNSIAEEEKKENPL